MCDLLAPFDTSWAEEGLGDVDKRTSARKTTLRRLGPSARKSFQDLYGKEAKRQHSARLKNTEKKTPKRKKQQCFRTEFEPDVHISHAEGEVYARELLEQLREAASH